MCVCFVFSYCSDDDSKQGDEDEREVLSACESELVDANGEVGTAPVSKYVGNGWNVSGY